MFADGVKKISATKSVIYRKSSDWFLYEMQHWVDIS